MPSIIVDGVTVHHSKEHRLDIDTAQLEEFSYSYVKVYEYEYTCKGHKEHRAYWVGRSNGKDTNQRRIYDGEWQEYWGLRIALQKDIDAKRARDKADKEASKKKDLKRFPTTSMYSLMVSRDVADIFEQISKKHPAA